MRSFTDLETASAERQSQIDKMYVYLDKKGRNIIEPVLKRMAGYETRKMETLMKEPEFEKTLQELRVKYGLSTRNAKDNPEIPLNLMPERFLFPLMGHAENEFFLTMQDLLRSLNIADDEAGYLSVSYHLLFGTLPSYERLAEMCNGLTPAMKPDRLPQVLKHIAQKQCGPEFESAVSAARGALGIRAPGTPEDIGYNYSQFYPLAMGYIQYRVRQNGIVKDIFELLDKYLFLNPNNDLDYLLLYTAIVHARDHLTVDDIKDGRGTGMIRLLRGAEVIEEGFRNHNKIFMELSPYIGSSSLRDLLQYIKFHVEELGNYVDTREWPERYYIAEYSYELEEGIRKNQPECSEKELYLQIANALDDSYGMDERKWMVRDIKALRKACNPLREQFQQGKRLP